MNSQSDSKHLEGIDSDILPGVGNVLEGRYKLVRLIGHGGMGAVLEARHLNMARPVAIKVMHPTLADDTDFARRFEREVLIAKELNHLNTVRIYDFGITDGGLMFLVMEYLDGQELQEEIDQGPLTIRRVIDLSCQLLNGLGEAHSMDVIHRDIKPGNIFLTRDRRDREIVKLLDFGIAKSLDSGQTALTKANRLIGTAAYLAPEVLFDSVTSKSSDIYACGLLMLEMLYGRQVMTANSINELIRKHICTPVQIPPSLEQHPLGDVLRRAVAKNPGLRFRDAEEMYYALSNLPPQPMDDRVLDRDEIDATLAAMDLQRNTTEDRDSAVSDRTTSEHTAHNLPHHRAAAASDAPLDTTELITGLFEQSSREVAEFVDRVADEDEATIPLEEGLIGRAAEATRQLANRFGESPPEETVKLSEELISEAVQRAKQRRSVQVGEVPDWTMQVTPDMIEEIPTSGTDKKTGSGASSATEDATIQLTDGLLEEVSIDEDGDGDWEAPKVGDRESPKSDDREPPRSTTDVDDEPEDQLVMLSDELVQKAASRSTGGRASTIIEWTSTNFRSLSVAIAFGFLAGTVILLVAYTLL